MAELIDRASSRKWTSYGRILRLLVSADGAVLSIHDHGNGKSFPIDSGFAPTLTAAIEQVCSEVGRTEVPLTAELALRVDVQGFALANCELKFVWPTLRDLENFRDRINEILVG